MEKNNVSEIVSADLATNFHILADLKVCQGLEDAAFIKSVLEESAILAGAKIIASNFHHFGEGFGVTGVLLLAGSHISIHTWPENNYAAIDIFICGSNNGADIALNHILDALKPTSQSIKKISRKFELNE